MKRLWRILLILSSSFLFTLVQPNEALVSGFLPAAFLALVPYLLAIRSAPSRREAALLGALFGFTSHAATSYWLMFFEDYAIWTIGSTSIAYALLHLLIASFIYHFSTRSNAVCPRAQPFFSTRRILALAATWTVWEFLKSIGFLGYPWGILAVSFHRFPLLIQTADTFGIWGMGFFIITVNAFIAELVMARKAPVRELRSFGLFVLAMAVYIPAYGAFRLIAPTETVDSARLVLVQANADSWTYGNEESVIASSQRLTREGLTRFGEKTSERGTKNRADLVVWSETLLNRSYVHSKRRYSSIPQGDPFIPFLKEIGIPLLTGAPHILTIDPITAVNAAILLAPDGAVQSIYGKQHPVPFAEYIPFFEIPAVREFMQKNVGLQSTWSLGTESVIMEIPLASGRPLRFGVPICFENAFADVCRGFVARGADLLINITNVSWSRQVSMQTQHLAIARFRSVETRRGMVQATNSGVSTFIDAEGRQHETLPYFQEGVLSLEIPIQLSRGPTLYLLLGDWLPILLALLLFISLIRDYFRRPPAAGSLSID